MEGDLAGVRFAEGAEHVNIMGICHCRNFSHETAFAYASRADDADHRAVATDCTLQQPCDDGHFPLPTDQIRLRQWRPNCYRVIVFGNVVEVEQRQQGGHVGKLGYRIPTRPTLFQVCIEFAPVQLGQ
jgi:hypothetical protein